jgi:NAD-dependent deacetylase
MKASEECDVLLAVGSTLSVYPAAYCVPRAKRAGARVVIVNGEQTELDSLADEIVLGDINTVLPRLCGMYPAS